MSRHAFILGLTGLAAHGKSTVAQYLEERYGFTRLSYAYPLKTMTERIDPIVGVDVDIEGGSGEVTLVRLSDAWVRCEHDEKRLKEEFPEIRNFWQKLGTEGVRYENERFWVEALENQIYQSKKNLFVIDDVRYPNEAAPCHQLWNIYRPMTGDKKMSHSSEANAGYMGEHHSIQNIGDLEYLYRSVDLMLPSLMEAVLKGSRR